MPKPKPKRPSHPSSTSAAATKAPSSAPPAWPQFRPPLPVTDLNPQLHPATPRVVLVPSFFPRSLCRDYVAHLRTLPLLTTPSRPKRGDAVRVNDRLQVDDAAFAERLWAQTGLREALSETPDVKNLW